MNSKKQAQFYVAMIRYDLDSDEVDLILLAEGLSVNTHAAKECAEAVSRNVCNWTPGGPVYDWDDIRQRVKKAEVKADRN